MKQFDVLSRSIDLSGPHFLEASAGTGKTFAIQHVVIRLILNGHASIDQILVVTFTRAATRELKDRIRKNLEDILYELENEKSSFDYVNAILEKGKDAVQAARENLEEALTCFDEAQIFTIHSFCHRILSEFAFQAKMSFGLDHPDSNCFHTLMKRSALDFLRTRLEFNSYSTSQLSKVLEKYKHDLGRLSDKMLRLSQKNGEMESSFSFADIHAEFTERLRKIPHIQKSFFIEDFELLKPCFKNLTKAYFSKQVADFARILDTKNCSIQELDALIEEKEFFLDYLEPQHLKVRARMPAPEQLHYPDFFGILLEEFSSILKRARDPSKIMLRMAGEFRQSWTRLFDQRDVMSQDQLLTKTEEALNHQEFREAARKKYRSAIIDEFQDTDPIQWNIFKKLFLGHAHSLFLVGDPKQSIYSFRSADIYTYLNAMAQVGEENKSFLDTNFRSDPSLVKALNGIFSQATAPNLLDLPARQSSLTYWEVNPRTHAADHVFKDGRGSVHFCLAQNATDTREGFLENVDGKYFFPMIAQELIHLHQEEAISFGSIAILIKDRYQAENIRNYLNDLGIPCHLKRSGSLLDSQALKLLKQLLLSVLQPDDLNLLKQLLAGVLIGWSAAFFKNKNENANLQYAQSVLYQLHKELLSKGFSALYQSFLHARWGINDHTILERFAGSKDIALYYDFKQLAEILIEEESKSCLSAEGVYSYLKELEKSNPDEDERLKRRQAHADGSVSIMTTHVSKGLEFEIVFTLGTSSRQKKREEEVTITENGVEKIVPFNSQNELCLEVAAEQDAEKLRQLYVALTRAKKRVYVFAALEAAQETIPTAHLAPIELYFQKMIRSKILHLEAVLKSLNILNSEYSITHQLLSWTEQKSEWKKPVIKENLIYNPPPKVLNDADWMLSFSALQSVRPGNITEGSNAADTIDHKDFHNLPRGLETGHILHRVFEKIFSFPEKYFALPAIQQLIGQDLKTSHLQQWTAVVQDMIDKTLHMPIKTNSHSFCLSDVSRGHFIPEMEFMYSHGSSLLKGFIDLFFLFESKFYFIDWKSNWLGDTEADYTREKIESEMKKKEYYLQAAIYTEALRRYVKLFDKRPFEESFGGAFYVFLRGQKAYHFLPDLNLLIPHQIKIKN